MYYCACESNVCEEVINGTNYCLIKGNLTNMDLVKAVLSSYKITHIVHFAAQSAS